VQAVHRNHIIAGHGQGGGAFVHLAQKLFMGEGGSIPFMAMLGARFPEAKFVVGGVLGPHSNAHGPDEFLHLDMAAKVTACIAGVLADQEAA